MNRIGKSVIIFLLILILILCIIIKKKFTEKFISDNKIPKIIHQTWKTNSLPEKFQRWSKTIKELHPDWEYKLWTDEDNRNFIKKEYPWFLKTYDGYDRNIKRVDAVRYFYLYHYGGVYIDMNFVCLKPLNNLLNYNKPVFGYQRPEINESDSIANAFMISPPKNKLFYYLIHNLDKTKNLKVLYATGPNYLTNNINKYKYNCEVKVLKMPLIYTHIWNEKNPDKLCKDGDNRDCKKKFPNSYTTTYWSGSWMNKKI